MADDLAFAYNIVGIPIAAGVLYPFPGSSPESHDRGGRNGDELAVSGIELEPPSRFQAEDNSTCCRRPLT